MLPADMTDLEALSLIGGLLQIVEKIHENRPTPSRIVPASCLPRSLRRRQ